MMSKWCIIKGLKRFSANRVSLFVGLNILEMGPLRLSKGELKITFIALSRFYRSPFVKMTFSADVKVTITKCVCACVVCMFKMFK